MKIIQWEKHGDVLVGINDQRWKRAVIILEAHLYFGYAPLGIAGSPVVEFRGTNKRHLQRIIQEALRKV